MTAPCHDALEQAAEWFALLWSQEATDADRRRWQAWLDSSDEHRTAWGHVERISGRFQPVQASPERHAAISALNDANSKLKRRRHVVLGLSATLGAGLLGWSAWRHTALPATLLAWRADHHAGTGELRQLTLADGTQVWLNAESAFNQHYSNSERRLQLVRGEILIQTEADPARPFLVDTPQGQLRALGTRFTVRLGQDDALVAVYEGAVAVRTGATGMRTVIDAGRQVIFSSAAIGTPVAADPARDAWTRGVLIARNTPLGEVVAELQRYHHGHLNLSDEAAALPVFGSYPLNDAGRALDMLASVMPIRIRRPLSWWTSISVAQQGTRKK